MFLKSWCERYPIRNIRPDQSRACAALLRYEKEAGWLTCSLLLSLTLRYSCWLRPISKQISTSCGWKLMKTCSVLSKISQLQAHLRNVVFGSARRFTPLHAASFVSLSPRYCNSSGCPRCHHIWSNFVIVGTHWGHGSKWLSSVRASCSSQGAEGVWMGRTRDWGSCPICDQAVVWCRVHYSSSVMSWSQSLLYAGWKVNHNVKLEAADQPAKFYELWVRTYCFFLWRSNQSNVSSFLLFHQEKTSWYRSRILFTGCFI